MEAILKSSIEHRVLCLCLTIWQAANQLLYDKMAIFSYMLTILSNLSSLILSIISAPIINLACFVGHGQIVKIQPRCHRTRHRTRVSAVCLKNILLTFEKKRKPATLKMEMDLSIWKESEFYLAWMGNYHLATLLNGLARLTSAATGARLSFIDICLAIEVFFLVQRNNFKL